MGRKEESERKLLPFPACLRAALAQPYSSPGEHKCHRNADGPQLRARQREQASAGHDNLRGASQLRTARRLVPTTRPLSAHTWRWARREKKRREMPHVQQRSYGPPGTDNMPRTAGAKRSTAALACLPRERPQPRSVGTDRARFARSTHEVIPKPKPQPNPEEPRRAGGLKKLELLHLEDTQRFLTPGVPTSPPRSTPARCLRSRTRRSILMTPSPATPR